MIEQRKKMIAKHDIKIVDFEPSQEVNPAKRGRDAVRGRGRGAAKARGRGRGRPRAV